MMVVLPRVVVSAPSAGHGKTAVAVGLLAGYAARGLTPAGFKIGPDHTDAAYLGLAAGKPGRNLDPLLVGSERIAPLLRYGCTGAGLAVIDGTMGLFDSLSARSEADSTAAVAIALRAPVVLVVDVATMGRSIAALVHGFRAYDEMLWLGGVILSRVNSDRHEQLLREALAEIGVPVLGVLRRWDLPKLLPGRQHGVVPVLHRTVEAKRAVRRLGEVVSAELDLDRLFALAASAPPLNAEPWSLASNSGNPPPGSGDSPPPSTGGGPGASRPVIAVAGGPGGYYTYPETAELLTAAGAEVVTVDPLWDERLPAGTAALVAGGALPESYAEDLSANHRLRQAVAELARTGRPVLAEGAALLWLAREYDGRPMCGVLDAIGTSTGRLVVGYRTATACAGTPVAAPGDRIVGYKQHRGVLRPRAGRTPAWVWPGGAPEGFIWRGVHASQLMLHWAAAPQIARRLAAAAAAPPRIAFRLAAAAASAVPPSSPAPVSFPGSPAPSVPSSPAVSVVPPSSPAPVSFPGSPAAPMPSSPAASAEAAGEEVSA